jgi:hypothetical protein
VAYLLRISKELDHFDGVLRACGFDLNLEMLRIGDWHTRFSGHYYLPKLRKAGKIRLGAMRLCEPNTSCENCLLISRLHD